MKKRSGFIVMVKLIGLVRPLTGYMMLAIFMGLVGHLCAAFLTIFGGYAVLEIMGYPVPFSQMLIFISVIIFAVMRGLLRYAEQASNHYIAFRLLALIRDRVFAALRRLCPAKLEGRDKGNLISIITSDIELLEVFYAHTISPAAIAFLFTLVMCGFMGSFHPVLGGIALGAYFLVGVVIPILASKLSKDSGIRFRSQSGELSSFVLDSLWGLQEIQQYGQGEKRWEKMKGMTEELLREEEKLKQGAGWNMAVTNTVILLADLLMLSVAVGYLQSGQLDASGVLIPVVALMGSFGPVIALANLGSTLQNTFAAGNRVLDILEEIPVVEEIQGKQEVKFGNLQVQQLTFGYQGETILKDVTVEFSPGAITGVTGKSGSGKSTLLKLMMRFWKIQEGSIRISDTDIEEINTENLREMEDFMTQETHLFHDSIKNNLLIASPQASELELIEACKKASVHDFIIGLPQGYDTPVGELGDTLSGGERQRIGLARVFLHNAPLVLLDEPTSNLDSLNEAVILKSLQQEGGKRTVVLVSHRESTMRIADTIYSTEDLSKAGRVG
ncbi:MAG: thiol reductant ABC exporter subunit CydC [Lachnospiraceae bacterium]|nr:thiol reductant ABC exporter subunit CydC [Lachnospiraceae bacterium]